MYSTMVTGEPCHLAAKPWTFDVTNPGLWMAHCHIAEHLQGGMIFSFTVARPSQLDL